MVVLLDGGNSKKIGMDIVIDDGYISSRIVMVFEIVGLLSCISWSWKDDERIRVSAWNLYLHQNSAKSRTKAIQDPLPETTRIRTKTWTTLEIVAVYIVIRVIGSVFYCIILPTWVFSDSCMARAWYQ